MAKIGLSTPWIEYVRKLHLLLGQDPEINIVYDNEATEVKVYVDNQIKSDALAKKLPKEKIFGNVKLKITVIPSNKEDSEIDVFRKIFNGNPILKEIVIGDTSMPFSLSHVIFENKVVQFFNDCLNDPNGLESTMYEDIARDVFEDTNGVYFNTEASDDIEIWP